MSLGTTIERVRLRANAEAHRQHLWVSVDGRFYGARQHHVML